MTAYGWLDSKFYLEAGGYGSRSSGTLDFLGADPTDPGKIHGLAPYGLDGTPFGNGKSPFGPHFNMRVGAQYTLYGKFNGAHSDFDNSRRNASDNNTLRIFTWIAF
jgi:hypothetical protein